MTFRASSGVLRLARVVLVIASSTALCVAAARADEPPVAEDDAEILGWAPLQAAGPPNTTAAGDISTAWASRIPDGQMEWLELTYAETVSPRAVLVYETFNPGALVRVSVFNPDGKEVLVWTGQDPTPPGSHKGISAVSLKTDFKVQRVKIYIDAPAVQGWNEIDAVGLRDVHGKTQWATGVRASSTYARLDLLPVAQPAADNNAGCDDEDEVDQTIRRAIEDLASDGFAVRERATLKLIAAGQDALAAVIEAAADADIEISNRAIRVLSTWAEGEDEPTMQAAVAALVELTKHSNRAAAGRAGMALVRLELRRWAAEQASVEMLEAADAALDLDDDGRVTRVNLALTRDTGESLRLLRKLARLNSLDLSGAEITDEDLARLSELDRLVDLKLIHTPLTGRGLAHLKKLSRLETLNVFATDTTDAALVHLREMKHLRTLTLNATGVTAAAVAELQKSLPDCRIVWDGDD